MDLFVEIFKPCKVRVVLAVDPHKPGLLYEAIGPPELGLELEMDFGLEQGECHGRLQSSQEAARPLAAD